MPADRRLLFALYVLLCGGVGAAILYLSGGHFAYALDDTYIYLALAENLPGNYSINAPGQEAGAPASSILYPYLLMPFMHTSFALYVPLAINLLAGWGVLLMLDKLLQQLKLWPNSITRTKAALIIIIALLLNIIMLIFCGLEHTLHVLSALVIFSGLVDFCEDRTKPPAMPFWLAIAAGPLLRYEALALSLLAAVFAFWLGWRNRALLCAALASAGPVAFGFYLSSLGFSWLPSSVLSKSDALSVASGGATFTSFLLHLFGNAVENLATKPTAWIHLGLMFLMASLLLWRQPGAAKRGLLAIVLLASLAHLVLGKFGWWGRYHVYILTLQLGVLLYVGSAVWLQFRKTTLCIALCMGAVGIYYFFEIPARAAHTYRDPGLLRNFLVYYWQDNVAAYDIGYISWQNDHEVYDLYGLASEAVRKVARTPFAIVAIPELLQTKKSDLVIARAEFMKFFWRPGWQDFAEIEVVSRLQSPAERQHFYLLNPARAAELRQKLEAFAKTLPPDVRLHFHNQ
jgi:hypothetical protein